MGNIKYWNYSCSNSWLANVMQLLTLQIAGSIRAASETVQLYPGTVRVPEHCEAIMEPPETTKVTQFPNTKRSAHGESHLQGNFRRSECETSRS